MLCLPFLESSHACHPLKLCPPGRPDVERPGAKPADQTPHTVSQRPRHQRRDQAREPGTSPIRAAGQVLTSKIGDPQSLPLAISRSWDHKTFPPCFYFSSPVPPRKRDVDLWYPGPGIIQGCIIAVSGRSPSRDQACLKSIMQRTHTTSHILARSLFFFTRFVSATAAVREAQSPGGLSRRKTSFQPCERPPLSPAAYPMA